MDKERLAAFADGALTPEEAAAVVMHLVDHPQDQAYVDDLMAANAALAQAFAAPMSEPVPARIRAAIEERAPEGAKVVPYARRLPLRMGGLALAASVALAAFLWPQTEPLRLTVGDVPAGSRLDGHLQGLPSGEVAVLESGAELTILATLPTPQGLCREVEVIDRGAGRVDLALACRQPEGWRVEVALSEPVPEGRAEAGYVAAEGGDTLALTPWLDRLGAGLALDAAAEAEAMARGWQP
ncbi:anti-sigma factor [Pseudorhodobacter sp. MZDSW-24AT]|uniref:anti-sigma factor family protein n=1 Tax=Pseudorhodobacter sp. MZDSW-24AT TaxID=2052957 RepID=UPI000C1F6D9D|nr:zf-HC2 domain-containing protein [Pseudorhodobacter sp. MZDSW-24AT]PJF09236.1 hypothetical protein CUR21_12440 [Pseudorhodobacter sp. MZDSW-24AT]